MKVPIYSLNGKKFGDISLVKVFSEPVRIALIKKAFIAEKSKKRQPYGANKLAGKRTSAHYHGRRGIRQSMMNKEMARMKRIHNQGFLNLTARFVPQATKGRKAHPPKSEKNWIKKINKKERKKAIFSAIAASINKDYMLSRGHVLNNVKNIPLIIDDKFEKIEKTREILKILYLFGLEKEFERAREKKVRAGKGKMRGRKYKKKKGPLLIIKEDRGIIKAAENIAGLNIILTKNINIGMLAPGGNPGRFCIWTKSAIKEMEEKYG